MFPARRLLAMLSLATLTFALLAGPVAMTARAAQGGTGQSGAAQGLIKTISISQLESIAKQEGYSVTRDKDGDLKWKLEGYSSYLVVAGDHQSIQFYVGFDDSHVSWQAINRWNRNRIYSRSYLDDEGSPFLELDLDLEGGVSQARVVNFLFTCRVSFLAWLREVIRGEAPAEAEPEQNPESDESPIEHQSS